MRSKTACIDHTVLGRVRGTVIDRPTEGWARIEFAGSLELEGPEITSGQLYEEAVAASADPTGAIFKTRYQGGRLSAR